jgi:hypothetical protein
MARKAIEAIPCESMNYKDSLLCPGICQFHLLASKRLMFFCFHGVIQPYESVIWDIETLHFTTSERPTSIWPLGTTFVFRVEIGY